MNDGLTGRLARMSARERRLLALLVFLVLPLGAVYGVVLPMAERRAEARLAVDEALSLQAWVAARQAELAALPPESGAAVAPAEIDAIGISGVEASLVDAGLRGDVALLSNSPGGGVSLRFDSVRFTELMPWLDTMEAGSGYAVASLRLLRGDAADEVQADLQLEPVR